MNNRLLKNQLKQFLCSPLFYITAILFVVFEYAVFFIKQQFFSATGTSDLLLFFTNVPYICIIVIPALCYKPNFTNYDDFLPFSRLQKYTVNLLYVFICFSFMVLLLLPGIIVVNLFGSVDYGQIFTSLMCLLFYGLAAISVCLLIQSFVSSQIICFIFSAAALAIINCCHLFAVYVNVGQVFTELFKKISFAWHFDAASKGIFDTRDITFYLGITFLLSFLTIIVKEKKAGKQWQKNQKITNILLFLFAVLFLLNGNNWYKRFDFSKAKTYSLSKYTRQLAQKADEALKITYYRSSQLNKLYPQIRDVSDFLTLYSSQNKNIHFQIKDPEKENAAELLENYGIYSQQFKSVSDNSTEYTNVYSAIILEYKGNTEIIPFIMSAQTLEYDLDGRILHLVSEKERLVNIIIGNGMTLSQDYNYVEPYLNSQGFVCNELFVENADFVQKLDQTYGPLLIIGEENINIENAIAIENYILQNKGNVLFTVSPYKANIEEDWSLHFDQKTNIIDMIENWGVHFTDNIAADLSCGRITMYSQDTTTTTKTMNYGLWVSVLPQENCASGITEFWPVSLELSDENAKPLIYSSPYGYTYQIQRNNKESLIETNPFVLEENAFGSQSNNPSQKNQTLVLAACVEGKIKGFYNDYSSEKPVKMFIIPDQYFLNSLMNEYIGGEYGDYRNLDYAANLLLKLNNETELAQLQGRSIKDTSLYKITDEEKFLRLKNISYILFFAIIPVILIFIYFFVWLKSAQKGKKYDGKKQKN